MAVSCKSYVYLCQVVMGRGDGGMESWLTVYTYQLLSPLDTIHGYCVFMFSPDKQEI